MTRVVLVVHDRNLRKMEKELLCMEGYRVVTASDGRGALQLLSWLPGQAVILLDLLMPYVDGWQVLERLNANPSWRARYAVILHSAMSNIQQAAAALNVDGTLALPFNVDQLLDAVQAGEAVLAARKGSVI